jgi:hypothetical protein
VEGEAWISGRKMEGGCEDDVEELKIGSKMIVEHPYVVTAACALVVVVMMCMEHAMGERVGGGGVVVVNNGTDIWL